MGRCVGGGHSSSLGGGPPYTSFADPPPAGFCPAGRRARTGARTTLARTYLLDRTRTGYTHSGPRQMSSLRESPGGREGDGPAEVDGGAWPTLPGELEESERPPDLTE